MDSNCWDPRFRQRRAESTRLVSNLTADAALECNSFVQEMCSCRVCGAGQPEDLQSFAVEVCPCEVCKTNTDKNPGQTPTNLSNAA